MSGPGLIFQALEATSHLQRPLNVVGEVDKVCVFGVAEVRTPYG